MKEVFPVISAVLFIIFFPFPISVKTFFSASEKKVFYSVFAFGKLRINSGYITALKNRAVFHFSDRKAVAIDYVKFFFGGNSPNPVKFIRITDLDFSVLIDAFSDVFGFSVAFFANVCSAIFFSVLKLYRPEIAVKRKIRITEDGKTNGFLLGISFLFGIYSLIGYFIGKIIKELKNVKKQFGK
ncbi:MAG TPA: hypothetical protein DDW54_02795 [Clostridiales bacterium]|nr:hypothetical protein [Clostridiales bacterium]